MVVAPRYAEYPDAEYTGVNADCNGNTVGYYLAHRANDGVRERVRVFFSRNFSFFFLSSYFV